MDESLKKVLNDCNAHVYVVTERTKPQNMNKTERNIIACHNTTIQQNRTQWCSDTIGQYNTIATTIEDNKMQYTAEN